MGRFTSLVVVVFLLGIVLSTNPVKAINCSPVLFQVSECSNFLQTPGNAAAPESSCCNAARGLLDLGSADDICNCLEPVVSQNLPLKAQELPNLCNLGDEFLPLVKCLAPSSPPPEEKNLKKGLLPPLPSVGPLPPLPPFPFPFPLPPLPFGPLPPFPFPLPPLPFPPPPKNEEKKSENGLLPPLPLPPLVPLPPLPLPPLPHLPLPPLPLVPPANKQN